MSKIKDIKKGRVDLTDYLIHFTRQKDGVSAFKILQQIISDGYIKTGWSDRGVRRTVFGKLPAICLSETPLYGFVNYVNKRREFDKIDNYGIAFTRKDLFSLGARTVIYGTTKHPIETKDDDGNYFITGFPDEEQYRYVLTTDIDYLNDWMHEREWRWTNWQGYSSVEGLPIWTGENYTFSFGTIVIIVSKIKEKNDLINQFKGVLDAIGATTKRGEKLSMSQRFALQSIGDTCILTLEEVDFAKYPQYRIEDAINEMNVTWLNDCFSELKPQ